MNDEDLPSLAEFETGANVIAQRLLLREQNERLADEVLAATGTPIFNEAEGGDQA